MTSTVVSVHCCFWVVLTLLSVFPVMFRMEASCLELALEGERLCKAGDFKGGTAFFEAAVQVGTEDLKTLSAIYSQMGNAYFYLKEYGKALEYHKHDLTLARWSLYHLIAQVSTIKVERLGKNGIHYLYTPSLFLVLVIEFSLNITVVSFQWLGCFWYDWLKLLITPLITPLL